MDISKFIPIDADHPFKVEELEKAMEEYVRYLESDEVYQELLEISKERQELRKP